MSTPLRSSVRFRLGEGGIRGLLRGICLLCITLCLVAGASQSVSAADSIGIHLREKAAIQSSTIRLKDVADLQGPDAGRLATLAQISLGQSPEFGTAKILSRHEIEKSVREAAGPISTAAFTGAPAVEVMLQGRQILFDDIAPLIRGRLAATTPWHASEIEILSIGNLEGMELPPKDATLRLSEKSAIKNSKNLVVPIEIIQDERILRSFWITARIVVRAEVFIAARRIPRGKIVGSGDLVLAAADIPDLDATYVRDSAGVLGEAARRNVAAGEPLIRDAFIKPYLVLKGETVQLRLERNGIVLTSLVRAEQNGSLGQVIRVRNLDFSTTLRAQVTGKSKVELQ
jgi:flagella basal body P-ring formation protein FlgA